MSAREFHGEEFYLWALQDYESLRAFRNAVSKRRPTEEELMILKINKPWEEFYRRIL
jgi:hypothetical protein